MRVWPRNYKRTNRQNAQLGIICIIGHFKFKIWDRGIDYLCQFPRIPVYSSLVQPIPVYSSIVQSIPNYSKLFQFIPTYSAYCSLYQPIPSYASLFHPMPAYSSLFPNPQYPILNPQYTIWNAQLSILSPIGQFDCKFSIRVQGYIQPRLA